MPKELFATGWKQKPGEKDPLKNQTKGSERIVSGEFGTVGQKCDPNDETWFGVKNEPEKFLFCTKYGKLGKDSCAKTANGLQKVFDYYVQQCLAPSNVRRRRQASVTGSGRVNDVCSYNTDCLSGMFCSSGVCTCLTNYVERDYYCYAKVNPTQAGCSYNEQCNAVWPGATCQTSGGATSGVCACPSGAVGRETQDGWICVDTSGNTNRCPTPEGAGQLTVLTPTGGTATTCTYGGTCSVTGSDGAQLYDCIQAATGGNTGFCCPSRAYACIQPRASGTGTVAETRYWYNSVNGNCEQFTWNSDGNVATANNFRTKEHCESYCVDTCPRGRPQYDGNSNPGIYRSKPQSCAGSTTCDTNYECTTIGSFQYCCASAASICSRNGGTTTLSTTGNTGTQVATTNGGYPGIRWYYSATQTTCTTMSYLGGAGDFNNFDTQDDCANYCKKLLCEKGTPIKSASGQYQTCSGDAACPSQYTCSNSVCCPRPQTICSQPTMVGTCGQYVRRYSYNPVTKDCEPFTFSGCQGNDNNFESLLECQNYCRNRSPEPQCAQGAAYKDSFGNFYRCSNTGVGDRCPANYECYFDGYMWGCCPIKAYTCSLSLNSGVTCGPKTVRWYYDTTTQSCQTYEYLGCDGNSNNFASRDLCEDYCGVGGCPNGGRPYREAGTNVIRTCSGAVTCPSQFTCNLVTVSGSQNNYCCPGKAYVCSLPPFEGTQCGSLSVSRWYFNQATKTCQTFSFNGCNSNSNNFPTKSQCENFCLSAACQAGETVFLDPNTQQPETCNIALQNDCPQGFTCRFDTLTQNYVCCGATDSGVCPSAEKAYIDAQTIAPRECQPNVVGSCPSSSGEGSMYLCRFNNVNNRYYCCTSATGSACPAGKAIYRNNGRNQPVLCQLNSVRNTCPSGYSCQSAVQGAFQGYCCTISTLCPRGAEYFKDSRGAARRCTVGQRNACPATFSCQSQNPSSNTGYCCSVGGSDSPVCSGSEAYSLNGNPVSCAPGREFNCPSGYSCTLYQPQNRYYCCRGAADPSGGCPPNSNAHPSVSVCDIRNPSCPSGYSCQYSNANQRYQCCGSALQPPSTGCPRGQVGYTESGASQIKRCSLGQIGVCPNGYSCQYSPGVRAYQCCGVSGGCPGTSVAYIGVTGSPQTCSSAFPNSCSNGFSCQQTSNGQSLCCTGGSNPTVTCGINQIQLNGQCLNRVGPGQSCVSSQQCQGGSSCSNSRCQCQQGTQQIGNNCVPIQQRSSVDCPNNGEAYLNPRTRVPQTCLVSIPTSCPNSHVCTLVPNNFGNSQYICCSQTGIPGRTPSCPTGLNPYVDAGSPRICQPRSAAPCPSNYYCILDGASSQYVCCGLASTPAPQRGTNGCPRGSAYLYPGTNSPLQCSLNSVNRCPSGYSCTFSQINGRYQCCSGFTRAGAARAEPDSATQFLNSVFEGIKSTETTASRNNFSIPQTIRRKKSAGEECNGGDECFSRDCSSDQTGLKKVCKCLSFEVLILNARGGATCGSSCPGSGSLIAGICVRQ